MMKRTLYGWILMFVSAVALGEEQDKKKDATKPSVNYPPVYTVSEYNPKRNPAKDLAETIARAKKERKRIILEIGGTW